jgi:hypothetical protein
LVLIIFATLLIAYVAGLVGHSSFADRYTSVVFPLFVLVAALGFVALPGERARAFLMALVIGCGFFNSLGNVTLLRTQAGRVARLIEAKAGPGDLVAYCPDQLGPAVARLLPKDIAQTTFPTGGAPRFVDWTDYEERNKAADPVAFAETLERDASGAQIWLVSSPGYRTFGTKCTRLKEELRTNHPDAETLVRRKAKAQAWEREELTLYPAG